MTNIVLPKDLRDFTLGALLELFLEREPKVAGAAAVLIATKYGLEGGRCLAILRNNSPHSAKILQSYIHELVGINLQDIRYSQKRKKEEILSFVETYGDSSEEAKALIALCVALEMDK